MKGTQKAGGDFKRTIFPEGIYPMTLIKAMVMWGKPSQYAPEGAAKIGMVWEFLDEDGNKFEIMDYLSFPKDFGYNEKSKFWKKVGEIAGMPIDKENVEDVDIDLGEFIQSYEELIEHIRSQDSQGRNEKAEVKSLKVGDQELMNKQCQLVVKIWRDGDKEGNDIASILQIGAAQKLLKPQKASAPATKPAAQQKALVSASPRPQSNTTEPAHADLPY